MRVATCAAPDRLQHLYLADFPERELAALEDHVMECDACLAQRKGLLRSKENLAGLLKEDTATGLPRHNVEIDLLVQRATTLWPQPKGSDMIAFTCTACQKKLSVKDELAGKRVKCPGCQKPTAVPAKVPVPASMEERTVPPTTSNQEQATVSPLPLAAAKSPTQPPLSNPDETQDGRPQESLDDSLTEFLAPSQLPDELGRLGKYRILKILGHGGMGVVYKGEDVRLKRMVAIKAMLPALAASASAGKRFLREAETMAKIEHDHIVRIYQIDEERGIPFMAMEFLKGEPLDVRLNRDEPMPLGEMLRIGREIAEGLGAAHATGLIHRDIKPGNIWLESPRNRVKILDFGLARAAQQDAGLTQQGAIVGTPSYMAPEQARGEDVDARCDLFSLGVVLYRLSTGNQPFHGRDTVSTLMSVAMTEPPPPIKLNAELPPEFSELVMKLLEKDAAQRIQTADEVVVALRKIEKAHARKTASPDETLGGFMPAKTITKSMSPQTGSPPQTIAYSRPAKKSRLPMILAALLLLGGGVTAAIVFFWQTADGVVRFEFDEKLFKVEFGEHGALVTGDQKPFTVKPGKHGLKITRDDFVFDTTSIQIGKGEKTTLKIDWLPGKIQIVQDGKVIGVKERPPVPLPKTPALADYALHFNAESKVGPLPISLELSEPFTIEAYLTLYAINDGHANSPILGSNRMSITAGNEWGFRLTGQKLHTVKLLGLKSNTVAFPAAANQKAHVAGVFTGKEMLLFVRGKLVGNKNIEGDVPAKGRTTLDLGSYYSGLIDEMRVSQKARYDKDFTPQNRFEPDADTLALYHFDEGAGDVLKDSSGNGHHGKIVGAKWVSAVEGSANNPPVQEGEKAVGDGSYLAFDGKSSFVQLPSMRVECDKPYTIETWVRRTGSPEIVGYPNIVRYGDAQLRLFGPGGSSWNFYAPAALATDANINSQPGSAEVGDWAHLAAVCDGKERWLYLNGRRVGVTRPAAPSENPQKTVSLGAWQSQNKNIYNHFEGAIREVRFSKTARYDRDFTPQKRFEPDADTLALYHFDEGSGDEFKDSSGNGHHGKIVGAKWVKADVAADPSGDYALSYDGTARVDVPSLQFPPTAPITLEAYVTPLAAQMPNDRIIVGKFGVASLYFSGQNLRMYPGSENIPFTSGRRIHIAGVRDVVQTRVYVDGKLVSSRAMKGADISSVKGWLIGQEGLIGLIDEVRVSKTARYIKEFVPAKRFEPDADTLALYHFDEGQGNVLTDSSGNGHHGKIVGAKWVKAEGAPIAPHAVASVDLLKGIDAKRDAVEGTWSVVENKLVTPEGAWHRLMISTPPPQEYQIDLVLERRKPGLGMNLGFVMGGKQCLVVIDGFNANGISGLETVDGKTASNNETTYKGQLLPLNKPTVIVLQVRQKEVTFRCEGKTIFRWQGDPARLDLFEKWKVPNGNLLFLGSQNIFHVHKMTLTPLGPTDGKPIGFAPLDPAWLKAVAAMPAEEQVEAVKAELMKRNPGFDGKLTPVINKAGVVTELAFLADNVTDLSPVRAFPGLTSLNCSGSDKGKSNLSDLSPLKDMKLTSLKCYLTEVSDLSPLKDMKLTLLYCWNTPVSDLSPLKDMKLITLSCAGTQVSDLSPLKDMPLMWLSFDRTNVSDLSLLKDMKLTYLDLRGTKVTDLSPLKGMPLAKIECDFKAERDTEILRSIKTLETINGKEAKEFWRDVDRSLSVSHSALHFDGRESWVAIPSLGPESSASETIHDGGLGPDHAQQRGQRTAHDSRRPRFWVETLRQRRKRQLLDPGRRGRRRHH